MMMNNLRNEPNLIMSQVGESSYCYKLFSFNAVLYILWLLFTDIVLSGDSGFLDTFTNTTDNYTNMEVTLLNQKSGRLLEKIEKQLVLLNEGMLELSLNSKK